MAADAVLARTPALWRILAAPLLGALAALGHAPFSLPVVTLGALVVFMALHRAAFEAPAAAARAGLLFGLGYFVVALHWIVQPFLVDAARHGWMAPFALVGLAGGMALFWSAGIWAAAILARGAGPFAIALGIALGDLVRSGLFGGFPWALVGSVWVDSPARLAAAWVGVHGLGLLTLLLAAGLARRGPLGGAVAACAALVLLGPALVARPAPEAAPETIHVRVIQANAAQHLKWRSDMIPVFWQRRLDLTAVPAETSPDVIVWPEVELPYLAGTDPEGDRIIAEAAGGAVVLAGAQRRDAGGLYNSLVAIDPEGALAAVYDKHHLVPFGEYFPGGALAARIGLSGLATSVLGAFTPGPGPEILDLGRLGRVAPLICYEAIFPRYGLQVAPRPDWIVHVTNDAWFGRFAGPQQHLDIARLRATELGVPVVRAANTGISAIIAADGTVRDSLALDTAGYLDARLPAALPPTPYSRVGNLPVWVVLALVAGALLAGRRRGGLAA